MKTKNGKKNELTRVITSCQDCVYKYNDCDFDAVGNELLCICVLSQNLKNPDYIIGSYSLSEEDDYEIQTPIWCPLKENDYKFTLLTKEVVESDRSDGYLI